MNAAASYRKNFTAPLISAGQLIELQTGQKIGGQRLHENNLPVLGQHQRQPKIFRQGYLSAHIRTIGNPFSFIDKKIYPHVRLFAGHNPN